MTMSHLVVLVLDDPDRCHDVLDAWEAAGAPGVTILDSYGLGRVRRAGIRDDVPIMPSLADLLRRQEDSHRTLFSVVEHQAQVVAIIQATEAVLGDLSRGHTGLLFTVPVSETRGLQKRRERD
jgi:nitrogen regulatory protein PII